MLQRVLQDRAADEGEQFQGQVQPDLQGGMAACPEGSESDSKSQDSGVIE